MEAATRVPIDHSEHVDLERQVWLRLRKRGYYLVSRAYHDLMPAPVVWALRARQDPTSLYVRTGSDRVAVHPILPLTVEWEVKTHSRTDLHRFRGKSDVLRYHPETTLIRPGGVRLVMVVHLLQ